MKMKYSELRDNISKILGAEDENKPKWLKKRWLLIIVIFVVATAGLLLGNQKPAAVRKSQQFITMDATRGDLTIKVTTTGNLAPIREVEVGSELSGIITEVNVDFNDRVTKGQPLARLDSTKFEAALLASNGALASAKARLERAEATMQLKKQNLKRIKQAVSLSKGQALSRNDLDLAEAEFKIAQAETSDAQAAIQQAEANLKVDETNLSKTIIVSPIDGMVLMRNVDPGQTMAASLQAPVLFTLAEDLARMELQVDVDEADVGKVAAGQWATFVVDAYPNRQFSAVITQVRYGSQSTNGVVTYKTLLRVDNPDLVLRPGMTATADIMIQEIKDAVLVPNAAFRFTPPAGISDDQQQGSFSMLTSGPQENENTDKGNSNKVWILKSGRPVPMEITTGPTNGTFTVIKDDSDLKPGTPLVVDVVEVNS